MPYCEDCGCGLSSGICSNCHEESFILTFQSEFVDYENLSPEFIDRANDQTGAINNNRKKIVRQKPKDDE